MGKCGSVTFGPTPNIFCEKREREYTDYQNSQEDQNAGQLHTSTFETGRFVSVRYAGVR